jgi:hypothetical protein
MKPGWRPVVAAAVAVSCAVASTTGCLDLQDEAPPEEPRAAPSKPVVSASGERSVPCADRQETVVDQPTGVGDVQVGDVTVFNLDSLADQYPAASKTSSSTLWSTFPFVVGAPAESRVVLTVPDRDREYVGLLFGARRVGEQFARVKSASATVKLHACRADEPRFSEGVAPTVGPQTTFGGQLVVAGSRCVRIDVTIDAESPKPLRFPVGGAECGS